MKAGKTINADTMAKVWKAHENGMDGELIAAMLDISYQSVQRIIKIMATAKESPAALDNLYPGYYYTQKRAAKEYFAPPCYTEGRTEDRQYRALFA